MKYQFRGVRRVRRRVGKHFTWPTRIFGATFLLCLALAFLADSADVRAAFGAGACGLTLALCFAGSLGLGAFCLTAVLSVHEWLSLIIGGNVDVPGLNVGTVMSAGGLIIFFVRWKNPPIARFVKPLVRLYGGLLVLSAATIFRGTDIGRGDWLGIISAAMRIVCIWVWLSAATGKSSTDKPILGGLYMFAGPLILGFSVTAQLLAVNARTTLAYITARGATIADPNYTMVTVAMAAIYSVTLACMKLPLPGRLLGTVVAFLSSIYIVVSGSRTALLALLVSLLVVALSGVRKLLVLTLVLAGVISVAPTFIPDIYVKRFVDPVAGYEEARAAPFENALASIRANPLFGTGRNTYYVGNAALVNIGAHNTLLAFLAEGGIMFGAFFVLFIVAMLHACIKVARRAPGGIAFVGIAVVFIVASNGLSYSLADDTSLVLVGYLAVAQSVYCGQSSAVAFTPSSGHSEARGPADPNRLQAQPPASRPATLAG